MKGFSLAKEHPLRKPEQAWYNEKYRVEVISGDEFVTDIRLLEPIILRGPHGKIVMPIGSMLHVGYWQIRHNKGEWCESNPIVRPKGNRKLRGVGQE